MEGSLSSFHVSLPAKIFCLDFVEVFLLAGALMSGKSSRSSRRLASHCSHQRRAKAHGENSNIEWHGPLIISTTQTWPRRCLLQHYLRNVHLFAFVLIHITILQTFLRYDRITLVPSALFVLLAWRYVPIIPWDLDRYLVRVFPSFCPISLPVTSTPSYILSLPRGYLLYCFPATIHYLP